MPCLPPLQLIQSLEVESQAEALGKLDPSVPAEYRCPLTLELFSDPVFMVESGQTYERAAMKEWLLRGNTKDPLTGGRDG